MQPPRSTATAHALGLPEIVSGIAQYLEAPDVLACSTVSRALRSLFIPYVWRDLHFGQPSHLSRIKIPLARFINTVKQSSSSTEDQEAVENGQDLSFLLRQAPLVRSLSIHDSDAIIPLQLGAACTRLESLTVQGLLFWEENHTKKHWVDCRKMMQRNRDLRSLSLIDWKYSESNKPAPGQPIWNPLLSCSKSWNLRSLKLQDCRLRKRDWDAFWIVCERLESLRLENTVDRTIASIRKTKEDTDDQQSSSAELVQLAPRLPRLRELILGYNEDLESKTILNLIISQCPVLKVLKWRSWRYSFPIVMFTKLFKDSTWPELDYIVIRQYPGVVLDEKYRYLLQEFKRPLRRLDIKLNMMETTTFQLIRTHHFATLESIDLTHGSRDTSDWTIQALTSCPGLRKLKSVVIHVQDMLESDLPWVCHGLQKLDVFMDMGFPNKEPTRRFTEKELEQCRRVYKRLAGLKELRVMDFLAGYMETCSKGNIPYNNPYVSPISLPLRLDGGLDLLAHCTKIERLRFWGGSEPVDQLELNWMTDHWKELNLLCGAWALPSGTGYDVYDKYFWEGNVKEWLNERGIRTDGSFYAEYLPVQRHRARSI